MSGHSGRLEAEAPVSKPTIPLPPEVLPEPEKAHQWLEPALVLHGIQIVLLLLVLLLILTRGAHGQGGPGAYPFTFDSSTNLKVNCTTGCSASSGPSFGAAFPAMGTAIGVKNGANLVNLAADGSSNLFVNCAVGCGVSAFTDNSAFTAGTTAIQNIGAVFNDGLADVTSANAAAPRITAKRALHINLRNNSGTEIGTASNPVRIDTTGTTPEPVTGTFWQSTQPVSIADASDTTLGAKADAKSTATDTTAITIMQVLKEISAMVQAPAALPANQSTNVAQVAGTTTDTNSGSKSGGTLRVVLATDQPQLTAKLLVTPDSVALPANQSVNEAQIGGSAVVADPCQTSAKLYISITQTANTKLVTGTSSKKISICSIHLVTATAQNIALVEGTVTTCGTGTAGVSGFGGATAATGWNLAANGGLTYGNGASALGQEGTAADDLCLFQSSSGQVSGGLSYVVQ